MSVGRLNDGSVIDTLNEMSVGRLNDGPVTETLCDRSVGTVRDCDGRDRLAVGRLNDGSDRLRDVSNERLIPDTDRDGTVSEGRLSE